MQNVRVSGADRDVAALVAALPSGDTIASPYGLYDSLRPHCPAYGYRDYPPGTVPDADEPVTAWVLLDYAHVSAAARDHRSFSSRDPLQEQSSAPTLMLVNHDNPEHDRLRGIVNLAFSRRRMEALEPWVREIVDGMVAAIGESDVEVMDVLASRIPARIMVGLLGLPEDVVNRFRRWATAFMLSADMSPAEREASNIELVQYFTETVDRLYGQIEAGEEVPDSLITALLKAEVEGEQLTLDEVIRFCITLVVAGSETTTFLLGNLLHNLAAMPDVRRMLAADPSLIDAFIDESLRHGGPPQRLFRIATQDVEVAGRTIREGEWVALFFAAANHDPAVFPEPEKFDITRPNLNKQLTFGVGIHHCLGSALARMEGRALIAAILERMDDVVLGSEAPVPQRTSLLNHGFDSLTLRFAPRRKGAA
ncbi:cytochrome P450 [Parvibaculum sp.]|jgi:cytochrome P450|uniref:cytochrome P450 n=1 Tax=Parvibaculum sp. TaxID=2024848 RepID=UPI001B144B4C|nr:cytochrome P450 [Parvibaculum sp.]MBO6633157.1 cytochrome P450 [Parvibaculum sp.]MBO6678875.1 cytochrome P450 [Parvibaculum sp.]MBO6685797.1 cytochrome P450 [Parvibaculum sp.]MBO6903383.1 cytochrome P450 [Parvibaculum sp.]